MHCSPDGQSLCWRHCGLACAAVSQNPAFEQATKRASMSAHCVAVVQVNSQKPPMHCCAGFDSQSLSWLQFGLGRVSGWHAPWLQ